ncbi:LexA family transcriptional regulator [Streptococcus chenjunshii]|uniref:LexA family transcriptional regulator n=2 Tax=Streptococcus chenjunshii TaxID=2173853 RepID=A0A372KMN8_9STRE|nr:LexA family transcriptional regulator [Streptococcus chenjunshii]RFU51086.1 LexA family transcriptional regulator [Streptococcus chenjunshii]RFU53184.1 LexA family transcriptional regulator [Streptococcus chenjunshii]
MKIIADNITYYRKLKGMTQKELAEKIGITPSTMSDYMNLRSAPSFGIIQKMADFFGVQKSDIDTTFKEKVDKNSDIQSIYNELHPPRQEKVLNYANKELKEQKAESVIEEPVELYEVLTTTKLAAGLGYAFNDYDTEIVYVDNKPPKHDLASFVYGDSMEPKYHSGDIVYLIDKGFSSYYGEICAVAVGDKTYLKKVYTEKGQLRLVSINPKYKDIIIDFPPAEDTHIRIFSVVGTDSTVEI